MIIETVTVTAVPTSIYDLLIAARGNLGGKVDTCKSIVVRNQSGNDILASDSESATPVLICDVSETQNFASFSDVNLYQTYLSASLTGSTVGLIISQ